MLYTVIISNWSQFSWEREELFHFPAQLRAKFFLSLNNYDLSSSFPCKTTSKVLPFPSTTTTKKYNFFAKGPFSHE